MTERDPIPGLPTLLSEALDLSIRAQEMDETLSNFEKRRDGTYDLTNCGTLPLWFMQQYDEELADWQRRAKDALIRLDYMR